VTTAGRAVLLVSSAFLQKLTSCFLVPPHLLKRSTVTSNVANSLQVLSDAFHHQLESRLWPDLVQARYSRSPMWPTLPPATPLLSHQPVNVDISSPSPRHSTDSSTTWTDAVKAICPGDISSVWLVSTHGPQLWSPPTSPFHSISAFVLCRFTLIFKVNVTLRGCKAFPTWHSKKG
jgi:hypothetical protein